MPDLTPIVIASRLLPAMQSRAAPAVIASRLLPAKQSRVVLALCLTFMLFSLVACARGSSQLDGWNALQPGMELRSEPDRGPNGEPVLALLYALVPGTEYGIERQMPIPGLEGRPSLRLMAKSTRVLYVAVVLLDSEGHEHKCASLLQPGEWRTLDFDTFEPAVADWSQITAVRFMDYTALLIGQGSVSLKLVGLPQ
jgi:hypothetical protein